MDKRIQANQEAKQKIISALFSLLGEKRFSEISVTDIIQKAGVARATYYRNFERKEDIIEAYLNNFRKSLNPLLTADNYSSTTLVYENLVIRLRHIATQKEYILLLCQNGFMDFIQEESNRFAEIILGDMPNHSIERYNIYLVSGALLNLIIQWMKNDCKESPEDMANLISNKIPILFENFTFDS